jgi:transcriptional regulator with XRE-family HTH domain
MDFPQRLATLRKERALTQQALADHVGVHVSQIRRYEAGDSTPTLDVLRKLAIALSVSADTLVFDTDERGPDEDLRLQFEATTRLSDDEKRVVKTVIEGILLSHEAKRWAA